MTVQALRYSDNDGFDDRFEKFRQFAMKCYRFPPETSRHLWGKKYLSVLDQEASNLLQTFGPDLIEECKKLISSYGYDA